MWVNPEFALLGSVTSVKSLGFGSIQNFIGFALSINFPSNTFLKIPKEVTCFCKGLHIVGTPRKASGLVSVQGSIMKEDSISGLLFNQKQA